MAKVKEKTKPAAKKKEKATGKVKATKPSKAKTGSKKTVKASANGTQPKNAVGQKDDGRGNKVWTDKKGYVLLASGKRDKRYQYPLGKRPKRSGNGKTRKEIMTELLSGKKWEFVSEGYDAKGTKSVTGAALKRFFILKCLKTDGEGGIKVGQKVKCGAGEARVYGGVEKPKKTRGKSKASPKNAKSFPEEDDILDDD